MTSNISENTKAVLLLTAPLLSADSEAQYDLLRPSEYQRLVKLLSQSKLEPHDLTTTDVTDLPNELKTVVELERLRSLLGRDTQLNEAIEHWQMRSIWVISPSDDDYAQRFQSRLKEHAPPLVYGCGEVSLLDRGGLAVVGSRDVNPWLVEYTEGVGRLAAEADVPIVSGGARGIDQAAMRAALHSGGSATGILADSLEKAASNREHRDLLIDKRLLLLTPFDPLAGFNVGHAMQRNRLIYALADAALVVNSDLEKGGTWAGAIEQLEKLRLVPVYVRNEGEITEGLKALQRKGAQPWPKPETPSALIEVLNTKHEAEQLSLL